jgi:hypothetical protein
MATIDSEIHIRTGRCPEHGHVEAVKEVPKVKFPFLITGPARGLAALRPYRCPDCGAKVS